MRQREWVMKEIGGVLMKMCRGKECIHKGEYQSLSNFHKSNTESDGYQYKCKDCERLMAKRTLGVKYKDVDQNPDNLPYDITSNLPMYGDKYFVSADGVVWNLKPRFPMGQRYKRVYLYKEDNGYITCGIRHLDGKSRKVGVHRLVALAFIPNQENKSQVNHKNGNRSDNRVENLEWATPKENINHAKDNGWLNPPIGERQWLSKIDTAIVRKIRSSKLSQRKTAKRLGISRGIVQNVLNGSTWKHVI